MQHLINPVTRTAAVSHQESQERAMDERGAGRRAQGAEAPRPPGTTPGLKLPFPPPRLEPACLCHGPSKAEAGRKTPAAPDF